MKLEGLPEGYEAVRWGWPQTDESYLDAHGHIFVAQDDFIPTAYRPRLIVRKVEPVATWPQRVFADGWIAEDSDGQIYWHDHKPTPELEQQSWTGGRACPLYCMTMAPVFRDDLPWTERCIQVGPSVEVADNG
jgi:hypothetical protein